MLRTVFIGNKSTLCKFLETYSLICVLNLYRYLIQILAQLH